MRLRAMQEGDPARVALALEHLRYARRLLVEARARRAAAKVLRAQRSAEGAQRHVDRLRFRAELAARGGA